MPLHNVQFIKSIVSLKQRPKPLLTEIAIVGRSNVGKSSLINTLFNRKNLAKISSTPGKTRLINYFKVHDECYFVDLPGYGYARRAKSEQAEWQKMLEAYFSDNKYIVLVLVLIDVRRGLLDLDRLLIQWLRHYSLDFVIILTKIDKVSGNALVKMKNLLSEELPEIQVIPFSAKTRTGKEQLVQLISQNPRINV